MKQSRRVIRTAWFAVSIATLVMALALAWAVSVGDLAAEGGALLRMPWGVVSLIEIYVGMALFGGWVLWREANLVRSAVWLLAIALIGNLVSCIYVLLALHGARGDALYFWMGSRTNQGKGN